MACHEAVKKKKNQTVIGHAGHAIMLMHVSLLFFPPFRAVGCLPCEFNNEWMLLDSNDSIACQNSSINCNLLKNKAIQKKNSEVLIVCTYFVT